MNDLAQLTPHSVTTAIRWSARLMSALILAFWGFFIVAHLIGDAGQSSRPLHNQDYLNLAMMGISLVGLGLAWKWELAGALLTLGAILLGVAVNWKILVTPYALMPLTACLFLLSWWLTKMRNH